MDKDITGVKKHYTVKRLSEMAKIKGPQTYFKKGLLEAHLRERATVKLFRQFSETELEKINAILDLGCGEGDKLAFLGRLLESHELYGIDVLDERIKKGSSLYPQIQFLNHPMQEKLPFGEKKFDMVTAFVSLMFLTNEDDTDSTFREINRVLKDSGLLLIMELNEKHYGSKLTKKGHAGFRISELDDIASRYGFSKLKTVVYSKKLLVDVYRVSVWTNYIIGMLFNSCPLTLPLNYITLYRKKSQLSG